MNVVNRALSGPINIHCDHSDSMGCRDSGWIQFYSESAEEAYENTILAVKLAEHPDIRLPVMVCQDGFITSHAVEDIEVLDDESVNNFIGEFQATYPLLDVDNPVTYGPLDFFDYYFEHKRQQIECMDHVIETYKKIADEFGQLIGKKLDTIEEYYMGDAEIAICVMSSSAGTTRIVVDEFRKKGIKAGMLKIRMFRPFPAEDITKWLGKVKAVAVLDRSASFGAVGGPIFNEVRAAFYEWKEKPLLKNHIFGLGGRELDLNLITSVYNDLQEVVKNQNVGQLVNYLGVRD